MPDNDQSTPDCPVTEKPCDEPHMCRDGRGCVKADDLSRSIRTPLGAWDHNLNKTCGVHAMPGSDQTTRNTTICPRRALVAGVNHVVRDLLNPPDTAAVIGHAPLGRVSASIYVCKGNSPSERAFLHDVARAHREEMRR